MDCSTAPGAIARRGGTAERAVPGGRTGRLARLAPLFSRSPARSARRLVRHAGHRPDPAGGHHPGEQPRPRGWQRPDICHFWRISCPGVQRRLHQGLRTDVGAALLRRRPKGLLPAARQELLDPSKAWWGGRRGRLADWPPYSISVSLGVVPRWYSRVVEVPVRIEVAAGFVAPGASEPPRLQPSWPPGGSRPAHG